ncbi:MAG: hypothetical protein ACRD5L_03025 [Bryobacteraceae bacterium]
MALKKDIISSIASVVGGRFADYAIGLTHREQQRREEAASGGNDKYAAWRAMSLDDAREIEQHFLDCGMRPAEKEPLNDQQSVYVYTV